MEASDRYGSLVYEYRGMDYLRLAVFWSGDRLIDWENGSCGFEAVYSIDIFKLAEDAAAIKTSAEIYVAEQSA